MATTRSAGSPSGVPRLVSEYTGPRSLTSSGDRPVTPIQFGESAKVRIDPAIGAGIGSLIGYMVDKKTKAQEEKKKQDALNKPGGGGSGGGSGGGRGGAGGAGGGAGAGVGGGMMGTDLGYGLKRGTVGFVTSNPDGSTTQTFDDGSTLTVDKDGNVIGVTEAPEDTWSYDPDSGKYYNAATGTYWDPETETEEFGYPREEFIQEGGYPGYSYDYYGDYMEEPGYSYDYGYDQIYEPMVIPEEFYSNQYDSSYDPGYSYDYGYDSGSSYDPGYSYDYGYDSGYSSDPGYSYDYGYAKGGMATPMMKDGGLLRMADGGFSDSTGNDVLGNIDLSSILGTLTDTVKNNPLISGAGLGAILSQILGQVSGGGNVNLGVDMSKYGQIKPRETTFGIGPAKFVPYEQYSSQTQAPQPINTELLGSLGVPGYKNPQMQQTQVAPLAQAMPALGSLGGTSPTYYTYGKPVSPAENLKNGGAPMANTGGPPMVAGRIDYRHGAAVEGPGDGQSDDIPAMLADGEYVIDAETVAMLGNGSNKAGAKKLDEFRENIREHKRNTPTHKIPAASKSPLAYLKGK